MESRIKELEEKIHQLEYENNKLKENKIILNNKIRELQLDLNKKDSIIEILNNKFLALNLNINMKENEDIKEVQNSFSNRIKNVNHNMSPYNNPFL